MLLREKILFSKEECDRIIKYVGENELKKWDYKDRSYFSSTIIKTNETIWIFEKLQTFLYENIQDNDLTFNDFIHFHKYNRQGKFDKHNDIRKNRKYGIGVLLNDDFVGGDFKFFFEDKEMILKKEIGNCYIFDTNIYHEIQIILDGTRFSILWFIEGKDETKNIKINSLV